MDALAATMDNEAASPAFDLRTTELYAVLNGPSSVDPAAVEIAMGQLARYVIGGLNSARDGLFTQTSAQALVKLRQQMP